MKKKRYDFSTVGYNFLTREQLAGIMGVSQRIVDRLIATGRLTPYRIGSGIGRGGQRIFYAYSQVERVKAELRSGRRARPKQGRR